MGCLFNRIRGLGPKHAFGRTDGLAGGKGLSKRLLRPNACNLGAIAVHLARSNLLSTRTLYSIQKQAMSEDGTFRLIGGKLYCAVVGALPLKKGGARNKDRIPHHWNRLPHQQR
eukprot:5656045-Amphidinium_carterae.1